MKKLIAIALLATVAALVPALADETRERNAERDARRTRGTVSSWDDASKTFRVKSDTGEEIVLTWNERTQIEGTPRVGTTVRVKFRKDRDGKVWAVRVAAGPPARKAREGGTGAPPPRSPK
jgi:hypothetical protein